MKWVTRAGAKMDRVACPWLITKFIDPDAEFLFVPPADVLAVAQREGGKSFDCPGADHTYRGGQCSFEVLVEAYGLTDLALSHFGRIVHGADIPADLAITPRGGGPPGDRPRLRCHVRRCPPQAGPGVPRVRRLVRVVQAATKGDGL